MRRVLIAAVVIATVCASAGQSVAAPRPKTLLKWTSGKWTYQINNGNVRTGKAPFGNLDATCVGPVNGKWQPNSTITASHTVTIPDNANAKSNVFINVGVDDNLTAATWDGEALDLVNNTCSTEIGNFGALAGTPLVPGSVHTLTLTAEDTGVLTYLGAEVIYCARPLSC